MSLAGHVARTGKINLCKILVGKLKIIAPLGDLNEHRSIILKFLNNMIWM
jgi:hypothetical protein